MLSALRAFSDEFDFTLEVFDVDADEVLAVEYDELVPVLFGSRGSEAKVQLCHYFLDEAKLRQFFNGK